jgi:dihydrofolate synthase/folylpolyglutamate synthase
MGNPEKKLKFIHIAGTNGKGSTASMSARIFLEAGYTTGLYTSPYIFTFNERMRVDGENISNEELVEIVEFVKPFADSMEDSPTEFELVTCIAFEFFKRRNCDIVCLEVGMGGELDSTNVIDSPVAAVITNIGLDHCDMLGESLPEIAFEKAGIIKPKVPVVIGESHPETDAVFERKVLYTNLPEPLFMGSRTVIMSLLIFADKVEPELWAQHEEILQKMDLQGEYQRKNLRTVLAALDVLGAKGDFVGDALIRTAERTGFRGRWEKLSENPYVICDIGHNEHGLKYNFAHLERMKSEGRCTDLIMVYGSVADKDVDSVIHLMPQDAIYVFTQAQGKRALPAENIRDRYLTFCEENSRSIDRVHCAGTVVEAMNLAYETAAGIVAADPDARPLIYVGGSTYVVSEAVAILQ